MGASGPVREREGRRARLACHRPGAARRARGIARRRRESGRLCAARDLVDTTRRRPSTRATPARRTDGNTATGRSTVLDRQRLATTRTRRAARRAVLARVLDVDARRRPNRRARRSAGHGRELPLSADHLPGTTGPDRLPPTSARRDPVHLGRPRPDVVAGQPRGDDDAVVRLRQPLPRPPRRRRSASTRAALRGRRPGRDETDDGAATTDGGRRPTPRQRQHGARCPTASAAHADVPRLDPRRAPRGSRHTTVTTPRPSTTSTRTASPTARSRRDGTRRREPRSRRDGRGVERLVRADFLAAQGSSPTPAGDMNRRLHRRRASRSARSRSTARSSGDTPTDCARRADRGGPAATLRRPRRSGHPEPTPTGDLGADAWDRGRTRGQARAGEP